MILDRFNEYLQAIYQTQKGKQSSPFYVLEAGGGSFAHFNLPEKTSAVTLDIDLGQLQRNDDVALKLCADLHELPLRKESVDMVICFNVIEHLEQPKTALENMHQALKPGGLLVLGCPNLSSLKGVITKLTPIQFHRWYYRFIVKKQDRGGGHYDAFPTPFKPIVRVVGLQQWLEKESYEPLHFEVYDGAYEYNITTGSKLRRFVAMPYYGLCKLVNIISFGRLKPELSDILFIARKL